MRSRARTGRSVWIGIGVLSVALAASGALAAAPGQSAVTPIYPPVQKPAHNVLIGVTPNRLATEPNRPDVLLARYNETLSFGVSFLVGNSGWTELEPHPGVYRLDDLNYFGMSAAGANLKASYTLHIIDTIYRNVPADLGDVPWNHPVMKARTVRLIEEMAPALRGRVQLFNFGYEIDGYFAKHPDEVDAFAELYSVAAARLRELVPGIMVSTTMTFSTGVPDLNERLAALNRQIDVLTLTYIPIEHDFTMKDPSVVPHDFATMKRAAGGRMIVLQEIAYPTAPSANASQEKQARFYQLAFDEFAAAGIVAANFMMLADLSDDDADRWVSYYGMSGVPSFRGTLQTLGMYDTRGQAKASLGVLRQNMPGATSRGASFKR